METYMLRICAFVHWVWKFNV